MGELYSRLSPGPYGQWRTSWDTQILILPFMSGARGTRARTSAQARPRTSRCMGYPHLSCNGCHTCYLANESFNFLRAPLLLSLPVAAAGGETWLGLRPSPSFLASCERDCE